jgi:hypothetical protein
MFAPGGKYIHCNIKRISLAGHTKHFENPRLENPCWGNKIHNYSGRFELK